MKKSSFRIAVTALILMIGSMSLSAQIGRGGECLYNGTRSINNGTENTQKGTCYTLLTEEQQEILDDLKIAFQAEMDILRAEMRSTRNILEKIDIRQEMVALRDAHIAEVQDLLEEWGIDCK